VARPQYRFRKCFVFVAEMTSMRIYVRFRRPTRLTMKPGLTAEPVFPDRPGKYIRPTWTGAPRAAIEQSGRALAGPAHSVDNKNKRLLPRAYYGSAFHAAVGAGTAAFKLPPNVCCSGEG